MFFSEIKQKSYYIRNHTEPQPLLKIVETQERKTRITHCYRDYKKKADQVVTRSVCSDHHSPSVFEATIHRSYASEASQAVNAIRKSNSVDVSN